MPTSGPPRAAALVECVINIAEGRDARIVAALAATAGPLLLDTHRDPDHHRSVLTLAGPPDQVAQAARRVAQATVDRLDLSGHRGAHPRLGVLDVVPFVPYRPDHLPPTDLSDPTTSSDLAVAAALRDDFARWLGVDMGVPSFLYGPLSGGTDRTLPQVRRDAFGPLPPDFGPGRPHPTAGATAVGARPVLVAYNVLVSSMAVARRVAPLVRGPRVRALALLAGDRAQVSCNLIDPGSFGPAELYDAVAALVGSDDRVRGAELVGLLPRAVLERVPSLRWTELGLSEGATVEARLTGHRERPEAT